MTQKSISKTQVKILLNLQNNLETSVKPTVSLGLADNTIMTSRRHLKKKV